MLPNRQLLALHHRMMEHGAEMGHVRPYIERLKTIKLGHERPYIGRLETIELGHARPYIGRLKTIKKGSWRSYIIGIGDY